MRYEDYHKGQKANVISSLSPWGLKDLNVSEDGRTLDFSIDGAGYYEAIKNHLRGDRNFIWLVS